MNGEQQKKAISGYMASVRFMDQQVGRLLDALDRLRIRENTIVVFISDHGYNLGEHDCWAKSSLWEGSVRIPMIVSDPASTGEHGKTCNSIIQLLDLYPTLADLCGLSDQQPSILQGRSLSGFIAGGDTPEASGVAYTTTKGGKASSIRNDRWRYNRWGEEAVPGMEELYDHLNDPEEFHNLVDNQEYQSVLNDMRSLFHETRNKARKN